MIDTSSYRHWRELVNRGADLQRAFDAAHSDVIGAFAASAAGGGSGPTVTQIEQCDVLLQQIKHLRAEADAIIEQQFVKPDD